MGAKKNGGQKRLSFEEILKGPLINQLKPYITEQIRELASPVIQSMAVRLMNDFSDVVHHQAAVKEIILSKLVDEATFKDLVAAKEDLSMGLEVTEEPAKAGDYLRIRIQGRGEKDKEFGDEQSWKLQRLATPNQGGVYTISKEVEDEIVGMRTGSSKTIPQKITQKVKNEKGDLEDKDFTFFWKVSVDRISIKPAPAEKEGQNESAAS